MLLATALALLIGMCSTGVQNKPATAHQEKPSPIISSFLELGRRKLLDASLVCGGAENVVKANPANIRKWIARFYYFETATPLEARVCSQ